VPARVHPGAVVHVWDHYVLGLRDERHQESLLSLYAITLSASLGSGHVALLYGPGRDDLVLADPPELGSRMQARWREMDPGTRGVDAPVVGAGFTRQPSDDAGFGWTVRSQAGHLEALWLDPSPPFWAEGRAPAFWDREDIWACFVDARRARLTMGDWAAPGAVHADERWLPKLGRTLTSAHVAYAEVRVTPVRDRIRDRSPSGGTSGPA
jgi:hypothetical protein